MNEIGLTLGKGAKWAIAAGGITVVATAAIKAYEAYERSIQVAQQNAKAYSESTESISAYKVETQSLIESINSGKLSSEELYAAKSRLLEIEDSLVSAYGSEADGLNLLAASADEASAAFDKLTASQANHFLTSNTININRAKSQMDRVREFYLPNIPWADLSSDEQGRLLGIISEHSGSMFLDEWDGQKNGLLSIYTDAREMAEIQTELASLFRDVDKRMSIDGKKLGNTSVLVSFAKALSDGLSASEAVVDQWGDIYDTAIEAAIIDDDALKSIDDGFESVTDSYKKLTTESSDSVEDRLSAVNDLYNGISKATELYNTPEKRDFRTVPTAQNS